MKEETKLRVEQLKSSFSVEGMPLIKSNKFSDEEIQKMKSTSTSHESRWFHLAPNKRVWADDEIAEQIELFMSLNNVSEEQLQDKVNELYLKTPLENLDQEKKLFKSTIYNFIGISDEVSFNDDFWYRFGSAPYFIQENDPNKKLSEAKKLYGACGMREIFEDKFDKCLHLKYVDNKFIALFDKTWNDMKEKSEQKFKWASVSSPYNTMDELEENTTIKKIPEESKKFYHDKTKPLSERIKVFNKYGHKEAYIFTPQNIHLAKIFDLYFEQEFIDKYQTINCAEIIEWWVFTTLNDNRIHINKLNNYHKIVTLNRNYKPSKISIERLFNYHIENLFLEDVGSFTFDW